MKRIGVGVTDHIFYMAAKGSVIGTILALIALVISNWWINFSDRHEKNEVHTNFIVNMIFIGAFILFSGLACLPFLFEDTLTRSMKFAFSSLFIGLAAASLYGFVDACLRTVRWDSKGLTVHKFGSPARTYLWNEIEMIEWDNFLKTWRIILPNGDVFNLHPMMTGADRLIERILNVYRRFSFLEDSK